MTSADLADLINDNIASFPINPPRVPEPESAERRSYRTI